METNLSRRGFLTGAAAAGALAAMGLTACAPTPAAEGGTKTADTGEAASSWRDKPEMPADIAESARRASRRCAWRGWPRSRG